jgi:regulator of CtrA degradation
MTELVLDNPTPWRASVVLDFASSELFDRTFEEGMTLVEETAAYLDGSGRQDAKGLSRPGALAYAGESMRLTTRLMQVASWLLVQRAVKEGAMPASDACDERYRLAEPPEEADNAMSLDELPNGMLTLIDRSTRLHDRILHLDRRMYVDQSEAVALNPVLSHMEKLQAAFG